MTYEAVVVRATDGPLPETIEQLRALKAQGATTVDVVISNTELVDAELLELVELEIRDLAEQNGLVIGSLDRGPSTEADGASIYGPAS
jgi:translation elongation factor EF-Tu-like GTPase